MPSCKAYEIIIVQILHYPGKKSEVNYYWFLRCIEYLSISFQALQ